MSFAGVRDVMRRERKEDIRGRVRELRQALGRWKGYNALNTSRFARMSGIVGGSGSVGNPMSESVGYGMVGWALRIGAAESCSLRLRIVFMIDRLGDKGHG